LPGLQELHEAYQDQGLVLIGIHGDQDADAARDALREEGATFANVQDEGEETQIEYGIVGFPTKVLIDRGGVVRAVDPRDLKAEVERLLAQD
jgi:hypothetical protein